MKYFESNFNAIILVPILFIHLYTYYIIIQFIDLLRIFEINDFTIFCTLRIFIKR